MINDDIVKMLPKETFIIGGSQSISKQNKLFDRKPQDYDLMIARETYSLYKPFLEQKGTIDESKYGTEQIFIVTFTDGSKIDFIIKGDCIERIEPIFNSSIIIDGNKYLSIKDIIQYKVNLLRNNFELNLSDNNKHNKDIIFLIDEKNEEKYSNYFVKHKESNTIF